MTTPFIITLNTAGRPLVRVRDGLLMVACWIMWASVLAAFVNGSDWSALASSLLHWMQGQVALLRAILMSLHISSAYFTMIMALALAFLLWSMINQALAPVLRRQRLRPALTVEDMARHFQLDLGLVSRMQKERQITVFHAMSGAVSGLCQAPSGVRQSTPGA